MPPLIKEELEDMEENVVDGAMTTATKGEEQESCDEGGAGKTLDRTILDKSSLENGGFSEGGTEVHCKQESAATREHKAKREHCDLKLKQNAAQDETRVVPKFELRIEDPFFSTNTNT